MILTKLLFLVLVLIISLDGTAMEKNHLTPHSYEVSLKLIDRHFCNGAIISPLHILTAAHCFYQNNKKYPEPMYQYMTAVVGSNGNIFEGGQPYKIKNITTHEELLSEINDFWVSDIAIVTLESEITYSSLVQPIDLPTANASEAVRAQTSIWSSPVEELQSVDVYLMSHEKCLNQLKEKYLGQYYSRICGYSTARRNLCLTFDGSPLVQNNKLIGIASSSNGCKNNQPDVYTNVYRSLNFIKRAVLPEPDETQLTFEMPKPEEVQTDKVGKGATPK